MSISNESVAHRRQTAAVPKRPRSPPDAPSGTRRPAPPVAPSGSSNGGVGVKLPAGRGRQALVDPEHRDTMPLYPRPPWTIAPWQAVAISVMAQLSQESAHVRSLRANNTLLIRDASKLFTDMKHHAKKLHQQQQAEGDKLGKTLFSAMKKHWDAAGRVHHQLIRVDYEAQKHSRDALRQEDLLKETEALTKKLLDDMIRDRWAQSQQQATLHQSSQQEGTAADVVSASGTEEAAQGRDRPRRISLKRPAIAVAAGGSGGHAGAPSGSQGDSADPCSPFGNHLRMLEEAAQDTKPFEHQLRLLNTLNGTRPLRDYQRSALRWMLNLYSQGLNGILADEMGLGKTVQTLALIAYFAEFKNDWGPHLIVVPTTVVMNWAAECRRWTPAFKVMTYIGTAKERAKLRSGWTADDAFHICITTYNLVINDRVVFRRRPWGLLVLDEAHHIKNFASLKWRALFDLQAQHRLMLTGTPLQNSVMELWSLFHFLLPFASAFKSEVEFRDWFSNPMNDMVEGRSDLNEEVVRRLQALVRPFLLRRLKRDVETQLPTKCEKVVLCRLSRRQRALYDDFIQRADTRLKLQSGGAGGVFGVLLQLRKVCNHPDLFVERPTRAPLVVGVPFGTHRGAELHVPRAVLMTCESGARPCRHANASFRHCGGGSSKRLLVDLHQCVVDDVHLESPTSLPFEEAAVAAQYSGNMCSPELQEWLEVLVWDDWIPLLPHRCHFACVGYATPRCLPTLVAMRGAPSTAHGGPTTSHRASMTDARHSGQVQRRGGGRGGGGKRSGNARPDGLDGFVGAMGRLLDAMDEATMVTVQRRSVYRAALGRAVLKRQRLISDACSGLMPAAYGSAMVASILAVGPRLPQDCLQPALLLTPSLSTRMRHWTTQQLVARVCVVVPPVLSRGGLKLRWWGQPNVGSDQEGAARYRPLSFRDVAPLLAVHQDTLRRSADDRCIAAALLRSESRLSAASFAEELWPAHSRRNFSFPEKRLLIYDCGKFQVMEPMLKTLRAEGHRALIFTQFTQMLNLLEVFLSLIGITYLRIDGATKPEARQQCVDTFNTTEGITCMILSTRSGGIGLNLTGADTVIFYDSDWNPTIDLQAQDRCHRIGQTRPVTIYRLISEHTVEEKILEKARERKMLNNVVIRGGQFHSIADVGAAPVDGGSSQAAFRSGEEAFAGLMSGAVSLRSFFHDLDEDATIVVSQDDLGIGNANATAPTTGSEEQRKQLRAAMASAEDEEDRQALQAVEAEMASMQDAANQDARDMDEELADQAATNDVPMAHSATVQSVMDRNPRTRKAKLDVLRKFTSSFQQQQHQSDDPNGGQSCAAAAAACLRLMATTYAATHPVHVEKQLAALAEHYGAPLDQAV